MRVRERVREFETCPICARTASPTRAYKHVYSLCPSLEIPGSQGPPQCDSSWPPRSLLWARALRADFMRIRSGQKRWEFSSDERMRSLTRGGELISPPYNTPSPNTTTPPFSSRTTRTKWPSVPTQCKLRKTSISASVFGVLKHNQTDCALHGGSARKAFPNFRWHNGQHRACTLGLVWDRTRLRAQRRCCPRHNTP